MVRQEWLNDGDEVFCDLSVKYFKDLIDYVEHKNLKADFHKWQKNKSGGGK